jgi:hypothetical protein
LQPTTQHRSGRENVQAFEVRLLIISSFSYSNYHL